MRCFAVTCLAALTACAGAPPPPERLDAPSLDVVVDHAPGTILSGPVAAGSSVAPAAAAAGATTVAVAVFASRGLPRAGLSPLASRSRLLVEPDAPLPLAATLRPSPRQLLVADGDSGAEVLLWLVENAPRRAVEVQFVPVAVIPGVTTLVEVRGVASPPKLRLDVGAAAPKVAVVSGDDIAVLAAPPGSAARPLAVVYGDDSGVGFELVVLLWRTPLVPPRDRVDRALAAARDLAAAAAAAGRPWQPDELAAARRQAARDALHTAQPRSALVYLAGELGAPLTLDLALIAPDGLLRDLLDSVAVAGELGGGFDLDRRAWDRLATRAQAAELAPELYAVLMRHAGEAGRSPSVILGLLQRCADAAEFRAGLVAENRIALEDRDPAARVRAHDWLARQSLQVPGYDPLAARRQRRAALAAAEATENGDGR